MQRRSFLAALFAAPTVAAVAVASKEPVTVASTVDPVSFDGDLSLSVAEIGSVAGETFVFGGGRVIINDAGIIVRS